MNVREMTPNILFPRLSVRCSWLRLIAFALLVQTPHIAVVAQTAPATGPCTPAGSVGEQAAQPCLTTLVTTYTQYAFNGLEKAAAQADDIAYASLLPICLKDGCNAAQLNLFTRLRELEDNAAQLLGFGETPHSLNLAAQGHISIDALTATITLTPQTRGGTFSSNPLTGSPNSLKTQISNLTDTPGAFYTATCMGMAQQFAATAAQCQIIHQWILEGGWLD